MDVKFYTKADVQRVLQYKQLIPRMEEALRKFSNRAVEQPVRTIVKVSEVNGFLGVMPAYIPEDKTLATKLVTFFPRNTSAPTHHALIVMFNAETGVPETLMDGNTITTMRTAAVSAVATKYLAREGSSILAILGAGVQARSHFKALSEVMTIKEARIWTRTFENAEKLANEIGGKAFKTAEEAVAGADVIVTVTASNTPVLKKEWVKPGAHVNAVGACRPDWQEIGSDLMKSSIVYVDSRDAAVKESGDVILSGAEIYAEVGEMVMGTKETLRDKTTVFKSLGLAVEDALSADLVRTCLSSNT